MRFGSVNHLGQFVAEYEPDPDLINKKSTGEYTDLLFAKMQQHFILATPKRTNSTLSHNQNSSSRHTQNSTWTGFMLHIRKHYAHTTRMLQPI